MSRKIKTDNTTEYRQDVKAFHQLSYRHVLVMETDMSEDDKRRIFHEANVLRKAGNELISVMRHNLTQLLRTKRYRKLQELYGKCADVKDEKGRKKIAKQMQKMQIQYNVTWNVCRTAMIPIGNKYGIHSVFALTRAEDVWRAVEKCLYGKGEKLHFLKRGELPVLRAKQIITAITVKAKNDRLLFKTGDISFEGIANDRFLRDEVNAILKYMANPDVIDKQAVETLQEIGTCISTYRPCYAALVCKNIRGKLRVYVHVTVEGLAKPKYDRYERPRHKLGRGLIGSDIGTQTYAYTSDTEVGLKNLAERGPSILENERKQRLLYRAMDRSRRATNPDNYNPDGTVKKGKKVWVYSNRYKALKKKHSELCHKNAENRRLAINESTNHLRSLGHVFVTEPPNASKLMKRAKETTVNKKGRINRKKRFGKSILNRCPGQFQAHVKQKFQDTGGVYIEVPFDYRASQYDHTADQYIKKKLSDRVYPLSDGTIIQRDWYSSFLMYNIDLTTMTIDKVKCNDTFNIQYTKELDMIENIKHNNIKILNSGIKVS